MLGDLVLYEAEGGETESEIFRNLNEFQFLVYVFHFPYTSLSCSILSRIMAHHFQTKVVRAILAGVTSYALVILLLCLGTGRSSVIII